MNWDYGSPDIRVTKFDFDVTVNPGDPLVYTVGVTNIGEADATGVEVLEQVPDGTTFDAASSDPGWNCSDGDPAGTFCTLDIGNLAVSPVPDDFAFAVNVNNPAEVGEVLNVVTAGDDGTNGDDPDPTNNSADEVTPVNVPCNGDTDITLTTAATDPVIVYEACNSITAGTSYTIVAGRDVSFRARNLIALTDGFVVESGAAFLAAIDPLAGQTAAAATVGD